MKVVVVGDKHMALGFTLAGVDESYSPETEMEAIKILDQLIESSDNAVIILSERIAESIREEFDELKQRKGLYPVIVEIPDKDGPIEGKKDPLKDKIRRAVGIDITSQENR